MARLVRATHDLDTEGCTSAAAWARSRNPVFMGRPDEPGDDDQKGMIESSA